MSRKSLASIASDASLSQAKIIDLYVKHFEQGVPEFRKGYREKEKWYTDLGETICNNPQIPLYVLKGLASLAINDYRFKGFGEKIVKNPAFALFFMEDIENLNHGCFKHIICKYGQVKYIPFALNFSTTGYFSNVLRILENANIEEDSLDEVKTFTKELLVNLTKYYVHHNYDFTEYRNWPLEEKNKTFGEDQVVELIKQLLKIVPNAVDIKLNYLRSELLNWAINALKNKQMEFIPVEDYLDTASD